LRHGPSGVYDAHWAERMQRFRESIPGLPEVIPFQRTPGKYTRLTMNVGEKIEGLRFDGFRFKAPASNGNFDLDWEFVCPCETEYPYRVVRSWNVTGSNRTLSAEDHLVMHLSGPPTDTDFYTGFQFYRDWWDYHEEGASLPK